MSFIIIIYLTHEFTSGHIACLLSNEDTITGTWLSYVKFTVALKAQVYMDWCNN